MKNFKWDRKYLYWGITCFLVIAASIAFFVLLNSWDGFIAALKGLMVILRPITYGVVIAYIVNHMVRPLEGRVFSPAFKKLMPKNDVLAKKLGRASSIVVSEIVVLAALSALIVSVLPQLSVSIVEFVSKSQTYVEQLLSWVQEWLQDDDELKTLVSEWINSAYEYVMSWLRTGVLPQMATIISQITSGVISIVKYTINFLIGIVVSIYLLYSKETFCAHGKKLLYGTFSTRIANKLMDELHYADNAFGDYIVGTLLDALIIGIVNYVFLTLLKMPYTILVSIILAVTNLIPMFGPFIGAIPCGFIILLEDPTQCLIFAIFTVVLQQIDGNIIKPKIHGSKAGISGFWILFAITVFGGLFGILGMIIGVPIMTILYNIVRRVGNNMLRRRGLPVSTEQYTGLSHVDPETGEFVYYSAQNESSTEESSKSEQ